MGRFQNFLKSITDRAESKGYFGLISDALPTKTTAWSGNEFLDAYALSLYTNRAITKRAEKVGDIEFEVRDKKTGDLFEDDPLLEILYKPNAVFTGRQFWTLYQKYYDLIGEVYIYVERGEKVFKKGAAVQGLHLLIPTLVTPKFGEDGKPTGYEYKTSEETKTYPPEDIIYIHNPNPSKPLRGQSLLRAGINAINTETQISTYHSRILENGGKVEGVFKFKTGPLTEKQLQDIKDKYKKEYAGAKRAGIPLFLGGDADYVKTGLNPDELGFLEAKKSTLDDLCILTGVPKSIMGSTEGVKYDNADADRAIFLSETVKPLLQVLTTALDERLFPAEKLLTFKDPTPENIDRKLKETETGIKNYYMTINEARERHGLDLIDNGDEIMILQTLVPLGTEPEKATASAKKKAATHPLQNPEARKVYWDLQMKKLTKREGKFNKALQEYLKGQEERVLSEFSAEKRKSRRKAKMDDALKIDLEIKIGKETFIPILTSLLEDAGVDAMELGGSSYDFNVSAEIVSWIENKAGIFLRTINETTLEQLKSEFAESLAAGEGRDALVRRIRDTYGTIGKGRAKTIARTEVHNATQYGAMQGYKQAGLTIKIWVAVQDEVTRDTHSAQDGEERPIDIPFSNGLMFPGDPAGPAEEVINCRCVI